MSVLLSATPEPSEAPPRIRLDLDSGDPGAVFTRIDATRNGEPLRAEMPTGSSISVAYDYDAPYGLPSVYEVNGSYLPSTTPDWTEAWASLAAWTGDTADYSVSGGKARSSILGAEIVRSASGTIQRVDVTDPSFIRIELLDSSDVLVASVQIDSKVTLTADSSTQTTGTGSYGVTLLAGVVTATAADSSWTLEQTYTGTPTKVQVVSLGNSYAQEASWASGTTDSYDIAVDAANNSYITDFVTGNIRKFDSSGSLTLNFNTASEAYRLALDTAGNIYITNQIGHELKRFDTTGALTLTIALPAEPQDVTVNGAGTAIYALLDTSLRRYSNVGAFVSSFAVPTGSDAVAMDAAGNLYVTNQAAKTVRKYSSAGTLLLTFSTGGTPQNITVDQTTGEIYIADAVAKLIRKFSTTGTQVLTFNPGGTPYGVATNASNDLWVVEGTNDLVRRFGAIVPSVGQIVETPEADEVAFTATATATLEVSEAWLVHPTIPGLSLVIDSGPDGPCCGPGCSDDEGLLYLDPASENTVTYAARATVHSVVGSKIPVVVSSGPRQAGVWTLILQTCGLQGRDNLLAALDDQQPLLLSLPADWDYDLPGGWYAVGDVDESRLTNQNLRMKQRVLSLPMQPVAQPVAPSSFGHTWADLLTEGLTWQGVLDTYSTWLNVLTGEPS